MNIAALSIEKPLLTWLIILFCLFGGIWGYANIGQLEDPTFTLKEAIVVTPYPGATAAEVEQEVTERLETAIQRMDQLRELRSESSPGRSEIRVEVRDEFDGDDLPQIWLELRNEVRDATSQLPPGAMQPIVVDDFADVYGIFYAITAPGYSDDQQRELAKMLRRELLLVDGVAGVEVDGIPEERIYVSIPQTELSRLGLPFDAILATIANENEVIYAGASRVDDRLVKIEIPQSLGGVEAIENLLIAPRDSGSTIRLGDIATVVREQVERPDNFIYHKNERAFTVAVAGLTDDNIVDVGDAVETRLSELEADIPVGVDIHPIYEQHRVVRESMNGFLRNLAVSLAIVIAVLCVFMGWRAGLTVGSVLLLTISGTLFFMTLAGIEMQRISLGALIIAMGMLVDNAIVVVEGMQTGVQQGKRRREAAIEAVQTTQWPLLGATAIGIMAFSGIGLSPDSTGEFMFSLFAVILISLGLSWVLAITVAPMIGYALFKSGQGSDADPYGGRLFRAYRSALSAALSLRWLTVAALILVTLASYVGFGQVRNSFFPDSNTPIFYIDVMMPEGTDILSTNAYMKEISEYASEQPEAVAVSTVVGSGATRFMLTYSPEQPAMSYGQLIVRVNDLEDMNPLGTRIRDHVETIFPDADARFSKIVFGPPTGADLEARFSGPDAGVLRALADEAVTRLTQEAGINEIRTDWRNQIVTVVPVIAEERARTLGVRREDVGRSLLYVTEGARIGVYRENDNLIPIIARAPMDERRDPDRLVNRLIWSSGQNAYVPIDQLVTSFDTVPDNPLIQRKNRIRTITVQGQSQPEETASEAFSRFQPIIESIDLPDGYSLEYGGEYEASGEANQSLGRVLPFTFIVMVVISLLLFMKVRQPLIVWLVVPMSVVGVVVGLLSTNSPFTFTALLGLLSLSGMLIKNAIVLVDEIDQRIGRGDDGYEAVSTGSVSRLRPVLLAAGTTILGMTPLLTDAFFRSMAVTIIGGLAFATILTMIAVPVIYALFFGIRPRRPAA